MAWSKAYSRTIAVRIATVTMMATAGVVVFASNTAKPSDVDAARFDRTTVSAHSPELSSTRGATVTTAAKAKIPRTSTSAETTVVTTNATTPRPATTRQSTPSRPPVATAVPPVVAATTPTTAATVVHGGSTSGGVYCNGWITRVAPASHLTIYDTTGGRVPTPTDCANARTFYNNSVAANSKYGDINVAKANNFRPGGDPPGQYAQHYVNWNKTPGVADATNPEGLVYHFDSAGHATLIGIYFFENGGPLTQPAGPLTIWHSHTPTSARMLHVWTFPGVRDPFALMLSGAQ